MTSKKTSPVSSLHCSALSGGSSARRYHAFLLRLWQEEEGAPWRIQVEHPYTREVVGFASLERLMQFLNEKVTTERKAL
ncbi:MAG: hypothetical protein AB1846_00345 [Chloroflexota bacterium]